MAIGTIIETVGGIVGSVLNKDSEKAKRELLLAKLETEMMKAQTEVNRREAMSRTPFVSCWRPFIGWMCGFSLLYNCLIAPILGFPPYSEFDKVILPILLGMLGLGGFRTYEKVKGFAK